MRRTGNLFERIVAQDNLRQAFQRAARGKRSQAEVRLFAEHLDDRLRQISADLLAGTIALGRFHQFVIRDPKERIITAPCFEERVLHHAIMNVCEPIFERWLIDDTYACRIERGRDSAVQRAAVFARRYPVFLKLDIRKYFDSIPHSVLRNLLRRKFKDARLLGLFDRIIGAFRDNSKCGLPIGSLTSQYFANFYLGWFDRYVKERLRVHGYIRYMDDMVLWGNDLATLRDQRHVVLDFLSESLQLRAKPPFLGRSSCGFDWLGCRVFSTHTALSRRSRTRFRRKLRGLERTHAVGAITDDQLQQRSEAALAFTRGANAKSWRFRQAVLQQPVVDDR